MNLDLCSLTELYVLGGLEEDELSEYLVHLKTCEICRNRVKELNEVTAYLGLYPNEIDPPEGMENRILNKIFCKEKKLRIWKWSKAVAALLFIVSASYASAEITRDEEQNIVEKNEQSHAFNYDPSTNNSSTKNTPNEDSSKTTVKKNTDQIDKPPRKIEKVNSSDKLNEPSKTSPKKESKKRKKKKENNPKIRNTNSPKMENREFKREYKQSVNLAYTVEFDNPSIDTSVEVNFNNKKIINTKISIGE